MTKTLYSIPSLIILTILIFLGGVGYRNEIGSLYIALIAWLLLGSSHRGRLKIPMNGFWLLIIGIVIMIFDLHRADSGYWLYMIVSGYFLVIVGYNSDIVRRDLTSLVFWPFIGYFVLSFLVKGLNGFSFAHWSSVNHHHLGDYSVLVMLVIVFSYFFVGKLKLTEVIIGIMAAYILIISKSRSAYVAFFVGFLYLANVGSGIENRRLVSRVIMFVLLIVFLSAGLTKSTLYSRQYYLQAYRGYLDKPIYGHGMGNFGEVSVNHILKIGDQVIYSSLTHSILLEFLVGLGILGLVVVGWILKMLKGAYIGSLKSLTGVLYMTLIIAIVVNMMFDYTYKIIGFWWLLMFLVGKMLSLNSQKFKSIKSEYVTILALVIMLVFEILILNR